MTTPAQITPKSTKHGVYKQLFNLKPMKRDGLVLQILHSKANAKKTRFIHVAFNRSGNVLVAADNSGYIFIVDFTHTKFWGLFALNSCTALKFSSLHDDEILVGTNSNSVCVINIETEMILSELQGHKHPVTQLSFSHDNNLCLTSSQCEAMIWDLKTNSKVQVLSLEEDCILKYVVFIPVTNNILACFHDDVIHVWKYGTFENFKQILPTSWNKHTVKSLTFTRNGRVMVIGGHSSNLAVFLLDTWCLSRTVTLPENIQGVRKIDFIPQPFDGGCNRILALLTGNGVLYFFDMDQNLILSKLSDKQEIIRFECCPDGKYIACVLCSGEINIYSVICYLISPVKENQQNAEVFDVKNNARTKKTSYKIELIKKQLKNILNIDKLKAILKEYGQYPDAYRVKIWTELLHLPNNRQRYNAVINHVTQIAFENLEQEYPLENKVALKNLKRSLNNLVTWCPFFAHVKYLPVFIFPFVKVFQNEPVLIFEAICTILMNWCQYWFEYFPLPPINTLAMIENVLLEHDPQLLAHLTNHAVTSKLYAWPLLEVAFSEVLTASEWCIFWDHVLTNEPAFLLMTAVAYNIINKTALLSIRNIEDFKHFYHNQNPVDIRKFISKTYSLLNNTSDKNHPRMYLDLFNRLDIGAYPKFTDYPKNIVEYEKSEIENVKQEEKLIRRNESELFKKRIEDQKSLLAMQINEEQNARLQELEIVCKERIIEEKERVQSQRKKLAALRNQLHQEEIEILTMSRNQIMQQNTKERQKALERLIYNVEQNRFNEEGNLQRVEDDLLKHYSELLKHKLRIEEILSTDPLDAGPRSDHLVLKKQQLKLAEEIEKVRKDARSKNHLKQLNIATGIAAMDDLIQRVEVELAREMAHRYDHLNKSEANVRVIQLEAETKELETEVEKLLKLLAQARLRESKTKISELSRSIIDRKELTAEQNYLAMMQKNMEEVQNKDSMMNILCNDYSKIKKLIHSARDGYEARPSSPVSKSKHSP